MISMRFQGLPEVQTNMAKAGYLFTQNRHTHLPLHADVVIDPQMARASAYLDAAASDPAFPEWLAQADKHVARTTSIKLLSSQHPINVNLQEAFRDIHPGTPEPEEAAHGLIGLLLSLGKISASNPKPLAPHQEFVQLLKGIVKGHPDRSQMTAAQFNPLEAGLNIQA